jgi:hypothetical protein
MNFGFGHAKRPWARWDTSTDSEKDWSSCKTAACYFFNLLLSAEVFPCVCPFVQEWRHISNYRGISILSAIPKLFEKLVWDVITPIRPLISDEQHDFVGGRSTMTSFVEFSNFVLSEMKDEIQVDAVYTYFSEAFDRVNHGLILGTLTWKFCRPTIFSMVYYVISRTQRVWVGDYLSETIYCHSGVPLGSYLGPMFFIADISDVLDIFENVRVLADDLKLHMRHAWCV